MPMVSIDDLPAKKALKAAKALQASESSKAYTMNKQIPTRPVNPRQVPPPSHIHDTAETVTALLSAAANACGKEDCTSEQAFLIMDECLPYRSQATTNNLRDLLKALYNIEDFTKNHTVLRARDALHMFYLQIVSRVE
jgi:hypothetical protein